MPRHWCVNMWRGRYSSTGDDSASSPVARMELAESGEGCCIWLNLLSGRQIQIIATENTDV
jgi:hypothetical protein